MLWPRAYRAICICLYMRQSICFDDRLGARTLEKFQRAHYASKLELFLFFGKGRKHKHTKCAV